MGTPVGAEHRDLEQRLRNIERSVRTRPTTGPVLTNTSAQTPLPSNVNITSINPLAPNTLTGMTHNESVTDAAATYAVTVEFFGVCTAATDVVGQLLVDGAVQPGAVLCSAAAGHYAAGTRTWIITGLAEGSRAFTATAYLTAATTVVAAGTSTALTVVRLS